MGWWWNEIVSDSAKVQSCDRVFAAHIWRFLTWSWEVRLPPDPTPYLSLISPFSLSLPNLVDTLLLFVCHPYVTFLKIIPLKSLKNKINYVLLFKVSKWCLCIHCNVISKQIYDAKDVVQKKKVVVQKYIYDAKENIYSSLTELMCVREYGSSKYAENKLVRWQLVGYREWVKDCYHITWFTLARFPMNFFLSVFCS